MYGVHRHLLNMKEILLCSRFVSLTLCRPCGGAGCEEGLGKRVRTVGEVSASPLKEGGKSVHFVFRRTTESFSEIRRDPVRGVAGMHLPAQEHSRNGVYFNPLQPVYPGPAVTTRTLRGVYFYNGRGGMWDLKTGQILN